MKRKGLLTGICSGILARKLAVRLLTTSQNWNMVYLDTIVMYTLPGIFTGGWISYPTNSHHPTG